APAPVSVHRNGDVPGGPRRVDARRHLRARCTTGSRGHIANLVGACLVTSPPLPVARRCHRYPRWVRTFDPDDELHEDPGDALPEREIDDDLVDAARDAALAALGEVTSGLPAAEHREGQERMASGVAEALFRNRHLVVEAGTGIGKSLAYLVPVALSKRRTVIATATKALQDQLRDKEVPATRAAGIPLDAAV